jgi:hypothetical protein
MAISSQCRNGPDAGDSGAMFGMFYVTLLIARLVSLYSSKSPLEVANREEIINKKRIGSKNSQASSNTPEE